MSRADILNMPRIADKLAKLQSIHTEHEAKMDRWNAEGKAQQKQQGQNAKKTSKPRNPRRRIKENIKAKARRKTAGPSGGNGIQLEDLE